MNVGIFTLKHSINRYKTRGSMERIESIVEYDRERGNVEKRGGGSTERNVEGGLKSKWAREDRSTDRNAQ